MTGVRCCHAISHHYCLIQRMITGWSLQDRCSHLHAQDSAVIITSLSPQNTVRSKEPGGESNVSTLLEDLKVQNTKAASYDGDVSILHPAGSWSRHSHVSCSSPICWPEQFASFFNCFVPRIISCMVAAPAFEFDTSPKTLRQYKIQNTTILAPGVLQRIVQYYNTTAGQWTVDVDTTDSSARAAGSWVLFPHSSSQWPVSGRQLNALKNVLNRNAE